MKTFSSILDARHHWRWWTSVLLLILLSAWGGTSHAATGVKVSALTQTNTVAPTDLIYLVSGSTSWSITYSNFLNSLTNVASFQSRKDFWLLQTNNAMSNLVVNFAHTNDVDLYMTNNATFTNWLGMGTNTIQKKTFYIRPQLVIRGVNYGNLGLSNPGFGVAIATNAQNPLWTTLTNGQLYVLQFTANGTNIFPTITLWQ